MSASMDRYGEEILGQPDALVRAARGLAAQAGVLRAVAALPRRGAIVLTGMGSSYDACLAAASVLGSRGVLATPIDTAELLHTRRAALAQAELLVIVSQSGLSAEAVRLAEGLREAGAPRPTLLAITNGAATPLSGLADLALDTGAGPEVCPSSMTFAAALVTLEALVAVLSGASADAAVLEAGSAAAGAASAAATLLAAPDATGERLERWLGGRPAIFALGRGVGLAAAEMTALSLMEAAGVPAAAMPSAEFRHGPLEIAGPGLAAVLFAIDPATSDLDAAFAAELAEAGAAVLLLGPDGPVGDGVLALPIPAVSPLLAPAVSICPLQLLARQLARSRGRAPETFAFAAKVTTRE